MFYGRTWPVDTIGIHIPMVHSNHYPYRIFSRWSVGLLLPGIIAMFILTRSTMSTVSKAQEAMAWLICVPFLFILSVFGLAIAAAFSTTQATGALRFATTSLTRSDSGSPVTAARRI